MNCIQDDRSTGTEEPLSSEEAASFLSTIHTLPSADYLADGATKPSIDGPKKSSLSCSSANIIHSDSSIRDARSLFSSPSDEIDEIPINICQDAWGGSGDDDASNADNCACTLNVEDDIAQDSSILKESSGLKINNKSLSHEGTLLDVSYHSRIPSYTSCCSIMTEPRDCFEIGRDAGSPTRRGLKENTNVSNALVVAPKKSGGVIRTLSNLNISPLKKKKEVHEEESETKKASNDLQVDQTLKLTSSFSTANETESSSNSSPKAAGKDSKTRSPSKFFRGLRSKRLSGAAALAAATVPVAALAADAATQRKEQAQNDSTNAEGQTIRTTFKSDVVKSKKTETPVHLISLSPEDTPSKYDEICYGSSASSHLATPAPPSPVDFMPQENSILKTGAYTCDGANVTEESVDMQCDLSPIVSKPLIKRAATNDSVELDDTGMMTMTPDSTDFLNTSNDSAEESLSDRCRSFLSGVSRTLFPEEKTPVEDVHFEGLGDDDAFECTLQNGKSGLFDVTVEEIKSEELKMHEEVIPVNLGGTMEKAPEKKCEQKLSSLGDIFHINMSTFNHLFGCAGSSSSEVKSIVAEQIKPEEATQSAVNDDKNETSDASTNNTSADLEQTIPKSTGSEYKTKEPENSAESKTVDELTDYKGGKTKHATKLSWVKSLRSRSSSLSLKKRSFGNNSIHATERYSSQNLRLEVLDEDVEATLPNGV